MSVIIETTLGDITVDLFVNERPQTCLNFLKLCKLKYYNLNLFHSVNYNFCAQTGDPTGKGDGGMSIHGLLNGPEQRFFQGESQPKIKHERTGMLTMTSHGNGLLGSQFMITLSPELTSLDGEHCVFGEVVEGHELLRKLNEAITDDQSRPYQDIRITHTIILEDPFPDPPGMLTPPASPIPPSTLDAAYSRIPADEPLADTCTQEELTEMVQAREAAARAAILEMVGDLPDAEVAPPENVLFVCKLNPVTTDHDLSIIFSRFGKVKSCEVIRDNVSGDSLQYAFVEFDNPKSCEEAFFKMDNVLIDDRRIHVDFSQSVAKWKGKGKGAEMLGPVPKGGWGNKTKNHSRPNERPRMNNYKPREQHPNKKDFQEHQEYKRHKTEPIKNNIVIKNGSKSSPALTGKQDKKGFQKKKRRRSPSSSSSSSTESSESTSSSDSSDSEPVKKKSRRRADKVLVVLKAPRKRNRKKLYKIRTKSKKYESASESDDGEVKKRKKKPRKGSTEGSSSEGDRKSKRSKKRLNSSEAEVKVTKKKRRKSSESSSSVNSSDDEPPKKIAKKKKKRKQRDSSSEDERRKRKKKARSGDRKKLIKKKKRAKSVTESSSSSD